MARPKTRLLLTIVVACLLVLDVGVLANAFADSGVVEGPKVVWNLATFGKRRAVTEGLEKLAEIARRRTNGHFTIKIHYGEALAAAKEFLDGLSVGSFEATYFCVSYHPGKTPALTGLDLPFLPFEDLNVLRAVHEAYFKHPVIVKEMARWKARLLMANPVPQYEFMGTGSPPLTLEDWKGRRVRALGGIGDAMRQIGAVPVSVTAPETYTALERGLVGAASLPFTYGLVANGLHEVAKWYTANLSPGTITCPTATTIDAWEKLPEQYKRLVADAKEEAAQAMLAAYAKVDKENLAMFKTRGIKPVTYSSEQLQAFIQAGAKPVWSEWVKRMNAQGLPGQDLLDFILTTAKKAAKK